MQVYSRCLCSLPVCIQCQVSIQIQTVRVSFKRCIKIQSPAFTHCSRFANIIIPVSSTIFYLLKSYSECGCGWANVILILNQTFYTDPGFKLNNRNVYTINFCFPTPPTANCSTHRLVGIRRCCRYL